MRIISGKKRGAKLYAPKDDAVRPTTDRVKEAVFGTLQNYLPNSKVLDLFCGSGSLGIEAWSRGADYVVLSDKSASSVELTKKNVAVAGNPPEIKVLKKDYTECIKLFKNTKEFDIVFLDPPYKAGLYNNVLKEIVDNNILCENALIVTESDGRADFKNDKLNLWKQKKYGSTIISFLRPMVAEKTV